MRRVGFILFYLCLGIFAYADKPNIMLILSDDMGYSDLGCYGEHIIKTPILDSLAEGGLKYTQFYNTARCCPSRASLLTGLHPHKAGIGHMVKDLKEEGYAGRLTKNAVTIAEVLSENGYDTYGVGKWHVSLGVDDKSNHPIQRGFNHFYGTITGVGNYYNPYHLIRDNTFITPKNDPLYKVDKFYYTTAVAENAILFLKDWEKKKSGKPFFMYVAFPSAHWPIQAPEEEIIPYKGKFDKGWDKLREEKFENMKSLGLLRSDWKLSKDSSVKKFEEVRSKKFELRCMETYAGMVTCMDSNIGKIIKFLRETNELDNTVIIYLQDNGACAENYGRKFGEPTANPVPKGCKLEAMRDDEVQVNNKYYRTRDGKPIYSGYGVIAGGEDSDVGYGKAWAYYSNTPFMEYKHYIHEGGIATPLIIYWRGGIKKVGEVRDQVGQLPDIMATILDISGVKYPNEYKGNKIYPMVGKSLVPTFDKDNVYPDRALFWEHEGNKGVRIGKWKIVHKAHSYWKEAMPLESWELYDMDIDRSETNNLAKKYPEVVKDMANMWDKFAEENLVKPYPLSKGDGKGVQGGKKNRKR